MAWWSWLVWGLVDFFLLLIFIYFLAPLGWRIAARALNGSYEPRDIGIAADPASGGRQYEVPVMTILEDGSYEIQFGDRRWLRGGALVVHAQGQDWWGARSPTSEQSLKIMGIKRLPVTDEFGPGEATECSWALAAASIQITSRIVVYTGASFVRFEISFPQGLPTAATGHFDIPIFQFPHFNVDAPNRRVFAYRTQVFSPPMKDVSRQSTQGPAVFYDDALNAVVVGPTDHFMVAATGQAGTAVFHGIEGLVQELPAGFTHSCIVSFATGINAAVVSWCDIIRRHHQVPPRDPYADPCVATLGYWTDNGAYYYYKTEKGKNYEQSLLHANDVFKQQNIPFGYFQLDSWWYRKIPKPAWTRWPRKLFAKFVKGLAMGGTNAWEPVPEHFPRGMKAFRTELGLPLAAHARWFSPHSCYIEQYPFDVSDFAAHPLEARFWDDVIGNAAAWGLICYEQDWIITMYNHVPLLKRDALAADRWLTDMANAAARHHVTIQYCMAPPGAFLYGLKLPAVTNARTGGDYWARAPKEFFFVSIAQANILAWGAGIWPSFDVFYSRKTSIFTNQFLYREGYPEIYALLSTLGGGLVCVGDKAERVDKTLLLKTCREDGLLLKPDRPVTCSDAMFRPHGKPYLMDTWTKKGGLIWRYVVSVCFWPRRVSDPTISLQELGGEEGGVLYDFFTGDSREVTLQDAIPLPRTRMAYKYLVFAPFLVDGLALIGTPGKFVTAAAKIFPAVAFFDEKLELTVEYLPHSTLPLLFHVRVAPSEVLVARGDARVHWEHLPHKQHLALTLTFAQEESACVTLRFPPGRPWCGPCVND